MSSLLPKLHIGITSEQQTVRLPADISTQTVAILAKRRVGKSYTASVIAEEMVALGLPSIALDPTSAWWGLRTSADGSGPGIPAAILGAAHADISLDPEISAAVADNC